MDRERNIERIRFAADVDQSRPLGRRIDDFCSDELSQRQFSTAVTRRQRRNRSLARVSQEGDLEQAHQFAQGIHGCLENAGAAVRRRTRR